MYGFPAPVTGFQSASKPLSKMCYQSPNRSLFQHYKQMAICLVFFNPTKSTKLLMNYLYIIEKFKNASLPFFTIELAYGDEPFEIHDALVKMRTTEDNIMFHKEQLCHILEKKIPWYYSKLLFADADILFESKSFYNDVSELLDKNHIVQPFTSAKWLTSDYSRVFQERLSVALMDRAKSYDSMNYHPGFAWAFRRKWFRKIGFYTFAITGSGDTLSAAAWLGMKPPKTTLINAYKKTWKEYCERVQTKVPRLACADGSVLHLWHGTHVNRQYVNRHIILKNVADVRDIVVQNNDDLFSYNYGRDHDSCHFTRNISEQLKKYFWERRDDDV